MLSFLRESPEEHLDRIGQELRHYDRTINLKEYIGKSPVRLERMITKLREDQSRVKRVSKYGSWLSDPKYNARALMIEGLETAKDIREGREQVENLVEGETIYKDVIDLDGTLIGKKTMVREGQTTVWGRFSESRAVQKAMELIRFGEASDFQKIYVELANGRATALDRVQVEHIKESTKDALAEIEQYCDSRWEGAWPWEQRTPYRVETMIEELVEMKMAEIALMQAEFNRKFKLVEFDNMGRYEIVNSLADMEKQVDTMITGIAKLSAAGIEASAKASAQISPEMGKQIEATWQAVVNNAASALTVVRGKVSEIRSQIENGSEDSNPGQMDPMQGGMDAGGMDGDMSPMDAMGSDPMGGMMADPAADQMMGVPMDQTKPERAAKPI